MFKRLFLVILIIMFGVLPVSVLANEMDTNGVETDIEDEETPANPKKDKKSGTWIYLASFVALGAGVYLVQDKLHREELTLNVDSIESNGDGSYIVSLGYNNPDNTVAFNEGDYGIRVIKGNTILLKKPKSNEFISGKHENEIIAVINEDSEIEYYAGSRKISINGKDIIEKEEKNHE